ncbi:hypothetical protein [Planktotalea sp.]|uniref:hypothetical protein n=1 Tax=Planktotalea sp. TaxID=2029877 RepID=UPI0032974902
MLRSNLTLALSLLAPHIALGASCTELIDHLSTSQTLKGFLEQATTQAASCGTSLQTGGARSTYCYVSYAYRSAQANNALAHLDTTLSTCFERRIPSGAGEIVNHPDSFNQIEYCDASGTYSLSLKDKAGLGETLIFLTSTPNQHCP